MNVNDALAQALQNPKAALHQLERIRCEESLYEFVQAAWPVKHPATPFVKGEAIETVCRHLEAVTRGEITKLFINIPPGCTKSYIVNVMWPLWEWGPQNRAHEQYISAGYNLNLPTRDLGYAREIQKSEWYQSHWPIENTKDNDGKENYANTLTGWRKATGIGGELTGFRGTRFIIDDPHSTKTGESDTELATTRTWFGEATPSRFNDPKKPVYVLIMQRLNILDLSGMIIEDLAEEQGWVHLVLPMEFEPKFASYTPVPHPNSTPKRMRRVKEDGEPLPYYVEDPDGELMWCQDHRTLAGELLWPERFDKESVDMLKHQFRASGGSYAEACQLQQRPVPRAGGMFNREDFNFVDVVPKGGLDVRGWDLAATKDGQAAWTVGLKMKLFKGDIFITDVIRDRLSAGEVYDAILQAATQDGVGCVQSLPQDPGQSGKSQKKSLAQLLHGFDFHFSTESGDKADRARPLAAQSEAGNVYILRSHWTEALVAELSLFPGSKFKDQADAASRAYSWLVDGETSTTVVAPKLIS